MKCSAVALSVVSGAVLASSLVVPAASADVFPPNPFPLTGYGSCRIDGETVSMSVSYREGKKDSSVREVDKVYLSGPLTDARVRGVLKDAVSGKKTKGKQAEVYRGFSTNVRFGVAQAAPGSTIKVVVRTDAGSCRSTLVVA